MFLFINLLQYTIRLSFFLRLSFCLSHLSVVRTMSFQKQLNIDHCFALFNLLLFVCVICSFYTFISMFCSSSVLRLWFDCKENMETLKRCHEIRKDVMMVLNDQSDRFLCKYGNI